MSEGTSSKNDAERRRIESEFIERLQEEMRKVPVAEHLIGVLSSLSSMAFLHLGLTTDTAGDRDLDQSRLAIDCFRALTDVLATVQADETVAMYRSTLAQMQMAYVTALNRGDVPEETGQEVEEKGTDGPEAEAGPRSEPESSVAED